MKGLSVQYVTQRKQSGFTLVELSAVIAVSSILLGVAVSVILLLERQEARMGFKYQRSLDIGRLSDQFRKDVHQAASIRMREQKDPQSLIVVCVSPTGETVGYHRKENQVLRQATDAAGKLQQERFLLPQLQRAVVSRYVLRDPFAKNPKPDPPIYYADLVLDWQLEREGKYQSLSLIAQIGKTLPVHVKGTSTGGDRDSAE